jgi:hypothetical protein
MLTCNAMTVRRTTVFLAMLTSNANVWDYICQPVLRTCVVKLTSGDAYLYDFDIDIDSQACSADIH